MPVTQDLVKLANSRSEEDRKKAIPLLRHYLESAVGDFEAWYMLACCHDFIGEEETAKLAYDKVYALAVDPRRETAASMSKDSSGQIGFSDETLLKFYVGYGSTLRNTGSLYFSQQILEEGIQRFPKFPALHFFLSLTQRSQDRHELAYKTLFRSLTLLPKGSLEGYERAIQSYSEEL